MSSAKRKYSSLSSGGSSVTSKSSDDGQEGQDPKDSTPSKSDDVDTLVTAPLTKSEGETKSAQAVSAKAPEEGRRDGGNAVGVKAAPKKTNGKQNLL